MACCARLRSLPGRVLLDSAAGPAALARYSFLTADPWAVVRQRGAETEVALAPEWRWERAEGHAVEVARRMLGERRAPVPGIPPFQGGAAGYLGYEWGNALEPVPQPVHDDVPMADVALGLYDWTAAWDHESGRAWLVSTGMPERGENAERRAAERLEQARALLLGEEAPGGGTALGPDWGEGARGGTRAPSVATGVVDQEGAPFARLRSSFDRASYVAAVERVREYIRAGDVFQVNISQRFELPFAPSDDEADAAFALYRQARGRTPAPFAAFVELGGGAIASLSPERFLRVDANGQVETRPIKGTRPRGRDAAKDEQLGRELLASEKDRAENVMIVDLLRNDLSRACAPGTVRAPVLCALERYETVQHLVSVVTGTLAPGRDAVDLLTACFPGGSITGAPKIRAREIIAELEPSRRGPYCGAIGYLGATGAMDTSIVIRTAVVAGGRVLVQAGGGVVLDSEPEAEYEETLHKATGLLRALGRDEGRGAGGGGAAGSGERGAGSGGEGERGGAGGADGAAGGPPRNAKVAPDAPSVGTERARAP